MASATNPPAATKANAHTEKPAMGAGPTRFAKPHLSNWRCKNASTACSSKPTPLSMPKNAT